MNFREALAEVSRRPVGPGGSFLTYSTLCDRCSDRPGELNKIELFYQIDKQISLVHRIQSEGRAAVPDLLAAYPTLTTDQPVSEPQYRRLIEVTAAVVLREEPPPAPAKKAAAPQV